MASEKELQLYEFICETLTEAQIVFIRDDRVLFANCRKKRGEISGKLCFCSK